MDQFDKIEEQLTRFRCELEDLTHLLDEITASTKRRRSLAERNPELWGQRKDFAVRLWAIVSELAELKGQVTEQQLLAKVSVEEREPAAPEQI